jgi:plasmid stability protein
LISSTETAVAQLIVVRNPDEKTVRALKIRAARHRPSPEAEHREDLCEALFHRKDSNSCWALSSLSKTTRPEEITAYQKLIELDPGARFSTAYVGTRVCLFFHQQRWRVSYYVRRGSATAHPGKPVGE